MARPKSEEKEMALLDAATVVVAAEGAAARTAPVAKLAGVAEGTLFRYFATKDALLNALYLHLKRDLADAMRGGFVGEGALQDQARSLWNGYVDWGCDQPQAIKALQQLSVAEVVSAHTRQMALRIFPEVEQVARACAARSAFAALPGGFVDGVFLALADTTIQSCQRHPDAKEAFKEAGFAVFWNGLSA